MEYQPQNCSKCNDCPEDILMLNCGHDLCLQCAAQRFSFEKKKNILCNGITCQICASKTQLDRHSIYQLEKIPLKQIKQSQQNKIQSIRNSMIQQAKKQKKLQTISPLRPLKQMGLPVIQNPSPSFNQSHKNGTVLATYCNQHPQDQILYFCLTCQCECICPECVIHGPHKQHEVKTLKRASPDIKQKMGSIVRYLQNSMSQVVEQKQKYEQKLKYFSEVMNTNKKKIKFSFDELRKKINQQQAICMNKIDYFIQNNKTNFDKAIISLKKHMELLKSQITVLNQLMKATQLKLLNNYAKNKRKYSQLKQLENLTFNFPQVEFDSSQITKNIDQIAKATLNIDFPQIHLPNNYSKNIDTRQKEQQDNKYKFGNKRN